jgi:hypothetical protein
MLLSPDNRKTRVKFYIFEADNDIINNVFAMAKAGKALIGQQMHLTKTQWIREKLHEAVQRELIPVHNKIMAAKQPEATESELTLER